MHRKHCAPEPSRTALLRKQAGHIPLRRSANHLHILTPARRAHELRCAADRHRSKGADPPRSCSLLLCSLLAARQRTLPLRSAGGRCLPGASWSLTQSIEGECMPLFNAYVHVHMSNRRRPYTMHCPHAPKMTLEAMSRRASAPTASHACSPQEDIGGKADEANDQAGGRREHESRCQERAPGRRDRRSRRCGSEGASCRCLSMHWSSDMCRSGPATMATGPLYCAETPAA